VNEQHVPVVLSSAVGDGGFQWWQRGVIYQVYPRSFADSNGDGVGDLRGITSRLAYLKWLGVDAVWISPIFQSPMADFGYDISDYTAIDPLFGTMDDFMRLVEEAHRIGLRVLFDFVPNHTSDQHPWFQASRASRGAAKRDWYIWQDAAPGGGPPNNWMSNFGGPAWAWDERTGQYYYHAFLPQQPDLNWRNPDVRDAMCDVLRFWLDRGVDGFRVDVIWHLIKDAEFRDNPPNPLYTPDQPEHRRYLARYSTDRPEVHEVVALLRSVIDEYDDRLLIGEIYLSVERLATYYGEDGQGLHVPFNFLLLLLPWDAARINAAIEEYEASLPEFGWPNWVLGNHDRSRVATRVGGDQARVAAMLLLTLRGTPTLYYGDEIGMTDVPIPPERVQDPYELRVPDVGLGRDPVRTPMQWDASRHAGFSTVEPWLPLAHDYETRNVDVQQSDERSMLLLHRRLLALRQHPALSIGAHESVPAEDGVVAYVRAHRGTRFLVALNLTAQQRSHPIPVGGEIALATGLDRDGPVSGTITLRPNEGVIVRLN
jgi:alpha-glucosidase